MPLVGLLLHDFRGHGLGSNPVAHPNTLGRIAAAPVLDCIEDRFIESDHYGEDVFRGIAAGVHLGFKVREGSRNMS